ncbi:MAG: ankyrin repeat domain-containing protein [Opitutaceae bacterium]
MKHRLVSGLDAIVHGLGIGALLLACASLCVAQQAQPAPAPAIRSVEVKVDAQTTHQTIEGFGAMWIEFQDRPEYRDPAFFDLAVNDLGLSILRIFAGLDVEPVNDDDDPNHFNWPAFKIATMNERMSFAQEFKKRGVNRFLLTVLSPGEFLKTNRSTDWGGALRADSYDEYAEQAAAMIILARKNWGINITEMTIQNELLFVEFYGSCVYHPEGAREAVRALMRKFQKEGIKTRIFMPEDMMVYERMMAYIKPTMADPETSKFPGGFCTHRLGDYDEVRRWYESTKQYGRENWMTETGSHPQTWTGAMNMAEVMYDYLVGGNFNAWIYERLTGDATMVSALFTNGKPAPKYYAAKHYFRYVRPGAVRVEAQSPDNDLLVSAYRHDVDGTLTVVLINRSSQSASVQLSAVGKGLPQTYSVYLSTESDHCAEQPQAATAPRFEMPPRSIVTLYGKSDGMKTRQALDPVPIAWTEPKPASAGSTERWGDPAPIVTPPILKAAGWQRHPGEPARIRQMVGAGIPVDTTDARGWTALHMAILCGNDGNAIPTLMELGANVNQAAVDGWTPLHAATASFHDNRYPVFRLIMDAKPDVNAKTLDGLTPLHSAVTSAHVGYQQKEEDAVNRVRDLLKAGAALEAQDINGRTPLHWAAMQGAQVGVSVSNFMVNALLEAGANVSAVDKLHRTPLHYAAEQGYDPIVAALLKAGAKIDAKDNQGMTPADLAAPRALSSTMVLLKKGASGATAAGSVMGALAANEKGTGILGAELIRAIRVGNVEEVKSLLARGADVTYRDSDGFRAIDRARDFGNPEILGMLQEAEKRPAGLK